MRIGVDIGGHTLKVCAGEGRGPARVRLAATAMPTDLLRPSFTDPNATDEEALARLLRETLARVAPRARRARVALPELAVRLRFLDFQDLPERREEIVQFIRFRLKASLPFPAEEARLDYLSLPPGHEDGGRRRLLCLIGRERVLAQYEGVLARAGLDAPCLAPGSVYLYNRWTAARDEALLLGHLGHSGTTLVVAAGGRPLLWRTLPLGGQAPGPDAAEALGREVADTLGFARDQAGLPRIERAMISGGLAARRDILEVLGSLVSAPVDLLDPFAGGPPPAAGGPPLAPSAWAVAGAAAGRQ